VKPIYKFILHVINNWDRVLSEAYAPAVKKQLFDKFKAEADAKNKDISDEKLNAYIDYFDRVLRNKPNLKNKDLFQYSLADLETIATASPGAEIPEAEITPDTVYNNEDNTIVIYNGSKEELCTRHRSPSLSWCITRSSFPHYRYSKERGFPTFYLARNTNLDATNYPLSFVAIQVRNVPQENKKYVWTNRENRPNESEPMGFDALLAEIPWLRDIPNIRGILKYIPLSPEEVFTQQYKNQPMPYMEWASLLFPDKKSYFTVRKGQRLFSDISNERFIDKYLSKFPDIAVYVAQNPGIVSIDELLQSLPELPSEAQASVIANLRGKASTSYLSQQTFSFNVKKLLVYKNKWDLSPDERIYVTSDKKTIVLLTIGQTLTMALHEENANYPSVKLTKENAKYLRDYEQLDQLPFKILIQLVSANMIDKSRLNQVIEQARTNPDSGIIIREVDGKQILLDSNSFVSYKIENGTVTSIPFNSEEVQQALSDETTNTSFQTRLLSYVFDQTNIPNTIDKDACLSIINSTSYNSRISNFGESVPYVVLTAPTARYSIFTLPAALPTADFRLRHSYGSSRGDEYWWKYDGANSRNSEDASKYWGSYFEYLRSQNMSYGDDSLYALLDNSSYYGEDIKKASIRANPPVNPNNRYRAVIDTEGGEEKIFLINVQNLRDSRVVGKRRSLIRAVVSPAAAARLVRNAAPVAEPEAEPVVEPEVPAAPAPADLGAGERVAAPLEAPRRRGRPAGGGQPRAQQAAAPAAGDFTSVTNGLEPAGLLNTWNQLSNTIKNRFADATITARVYGDRGAGRRDNILRGRGRVRQIIESGNNKIYIIQLQNGTYIASVVLQPGNVHLLLTPNTFTPIGSPDNLLATLQAQNLAESEKGIAINMFLAENPHMLEETKEILRKHLNKNKYENQRS